MIYRNNSIDNCNEFITPPGNEFEILYSPKVNKDGTIELIESGKKDIRQEINSWREQTDMSYILRQMANGAVYQRSDLQFGDFADAPKTMAEAMQIMLDAESAFYGLDLDTRNKFDNDYRKWIVMASGDPEKFADLMGFQTETAIPADTEGKESEE